MKNSHVRRGNAYKHTWTRESLNPLRMKSFNPYNNTIRYVPFIFISCIEQKIREIEQFAQEHITGNWQSEDLNPCSEACAIKHYLTPSLRFIHSLDTPLSHKPVYTKVHKFYLHNFMGLICNACYSGLL